MEEVSIAGCRIEGAPTTVGKVSSEQAGGVGDGILGDGVASLAAVSIITSVLSSLSSSSMGGIDEGTVHVIEVK